MTQAIPILLYHSISNDCTEAYRHWTVSPQGFERHLSWLSEAGCGALTVSQFVTLRTAGRVPERPVIITFDDGLQDFLAGAFPLLQRYDFPATLYVTAGYVGGTSRWLSNLGEGDRPMLDWCQLRQLAASGIEIGGHTMSHAQLDVLELPEARQEILRCKKVIEENIGSAITSFAYPHGYSTHAIRNVLAHSGFASACRVRHALSSTDEDCYALSRIVIDETLQEEDLLAYVHGHALPVAPAPATLASWGWRQLRNLNRHLQA